MGNSTSQDEKVARVGKALNGRFENITGYKESRIQKGVAVTSLYDFEPKGQAYSKCFDHDIYHETLQEYIIDDEPTVSERFDSSKVLWIFEEGILKRLNQISSNSGCKIVPEWYGNIPEEKRFFMEYIKTQSYKEKFIEIDKKLSELYTELVRNEKSARVYDINELEKQKEWLKGEGLLYIARFHNLCEQNRKKLFSDIGQRKTKEQYARQKEYLEKMLMDFYKDLNLSQENLESYLKKEKGIDISKIIETSFKLKQSYSDKLSPVHGDFGVHHLTLDGICFDFDEFRLDLVQDDIVRFLNSEFSTPFTEDKRDEEEIKIPSKLADYFIDKQRLEGKIKWEDKFKQSPEALLSNNGLKDEFLDFLLSYYCERIEEDIHIYAINKATDPKVLERFAEGHPNLKSLDDFQRFRINDIDRSLSFLLRTEYGRKKILRDKKDVTQYFESIRNFFERSSIIKEERFKEDAKGVLEL